MKKNFPNLKVTMKKFVKWVLSSVIILTAGQMLAQQPTIVIYNSDLGLVQETRTVQLSRGEQVLSITDVAAQIQPATVHLDATDFSVREQNFQFDLVDPNKVFDKYLGETVTIRTGSEETLSGRLLNRSGTLIMLQNEDGSLRMLNTENIQEYAFPRLPEGLFIRPTLQWIVNSRTSGSAKVDLSYLTGGMSWNAEYILLLDQDNEEAVLSSWVTLQNRSGASFEDATLKLVAGDIHRAAPEGRGGAEAVTMDMHTLARRAPISERQVFEYYLYEINFPTDLHQNAMKQVVFREPAEIETDRVYSFEHAERENVKSENVNVEIIFQNSEQNDLGLALPAGIVRMMQKDEDGSEILVGEDRIQHTPKDEEVRLQAGSAFDIVGDRKITDIERRGDDFERISVQINLRNHKNNRVTVQVRDNFYGDWEVLKSTHNEEKVDANTLEFSVRIPGDGETEIQYTIERRR
jgi:hypothetical protein